MTMSKTMTKLSLILLLTDSLIFSQINHKVTSEDSKLTKLFDGGFFTEGPIYGPDGHVYFSDLTFTSETNMQAGILWKYDSASGNTSVYRSPSGMANGIEFDKSGNMIVCEGADFGGRKITSTDLSSGKAKILTALFNALPYNSPNDLVIDSGNRIYFTDPRYSGYESIDQPYFGVYRIDTDGEVTLLINDIPMPNGIALSPDEHKLYVGCNFEGNYEKGLNPETSIFGLGINFKPADKKCDVGAQYIYTDGVGSYSTSVASVSNVAAQGLPAPVSIPDTKTRLNSFQLYAKYQYSKNLLFRANYWYQSFKSNDWAYDNATMTSSNNVLLTGHQSPNYHANVFGFSVAYTGW